MIKGDLTASEPETAMKGIVAVAAATSGPVTALFFDGSVVGLSAAGLTSGLAALGLGGVVGGERDGHRDRRRDRARGGGGPARA